MVELTSLFDVMDSCVVDCSVDFDVSIERKKPQQIEKKKELKELPREEVIVQIIEM
jgi:hypothetical protein